ncbi:GroES-like protein [Echria macrotheca]|uniref:GroES-like protein n=1 Tax=Echria macrotheca TaxID=438768 RepID=A0AAJ0B0D2_9PEZI|nr:GroES-like protein [Echria macrotheca]
MPQPSDQCRYPEPMSTSRFKPVRLSSLIRSLSSSANSSSSKRADTASKMHELALYGVPKFTGIRRQVEIPKPGPGEVLIKVVAVGLNPKDWKITKSRGEDRAINAGDDVTGIIESVGDGVYEYKPGDRVAAFHRMFDPSGAYAEYSIAPASTTFPLPPNISFEAGAGLPLSSMTAAIALYQALALPLPTATGKKGIPLLIYGGATAVGAFALQFAKLSNIHPVITVAGAGIDFVKSLDAADHIIDYRKGDVAKNILSALGGTPLHHALDTISGKGSYEIISDVLTASGGGEINMLDPPEDESWKWPEGVKFTRTFVSSAYHRKHNYISQERANADGDFAFFFYRYMSLLLARGTFKPHPHEVLAGGLDGIVGGIQALHDNKVSAKKLVVRIADTPGL